MTTQPKFNLNYIISNYQKPSLKEKQTIKTFLRNEGFSDNANALGIIGLGGTISSGYSYNKETIVVGPYASAAQILESIQGKFGINNDKYTATDLFSKDSREINNDDLILLLNTLDTIKNKRILITCGTYMLPMITLLLVQLLKDSNKIIGVTGSMLPLGFTDSDAQLNVMSTITAINALSSKGLKIGSKIFACFHGNIYQDLKSLKTLNLHPLRKKDIVIAYPKINTPVDIRE